MPMNEITKQVYYDVLKYKGKNYMILHAIEEMSELVKELLKNVNRGKDNTDDIFEEVADVTILLERVKQIYDISDDKLWDYINQKTVDKILPRVEKWKKMQG
jgi:DNA-binding transcriptional regulator GbsR (MarR family)